MARRESEATPDHLPTFRLLDVEGRPQHAQIGSGYAVWVPPKEAESRLPRDPCCDARLGPTADGKLSRYLNVPPPAIRKCAPWEISALFDCPNLVVHPATMHAGSALSFSVAGYQSAGGAFEDREARRGMLLLLVCGDAPNGHAASRSQVHARRARVGYRPCWTAGTHVAISVTVSRSECLTLRAQAKRRAAGRALNGGGCLLCLVGSFAPSLGSRGP